MLRLGHSKLSIDGHYNQICQCGSIKTELHIFLECPSTYTSRQMLISSVSKILVDENTFSHYEFTSLNRIESTKILLFGHPDLPKNPSLCLFKQMCLILSAVFSLCNVSSVRLCASLFCLAFALPMIISGLGLPTLAVCKQINKNKIK